MKKYILLFAFLFILLGCQNNTTVTVIENSITVPLNTEQTISFRSEEVHFELLETSEKNWTGSNDVTYLYDLKQDKEVLGNLSVTVRTLDNSDLFVFTRLDNHKEQPLSLSTSLPFAGSNRYRHTDFDQVYKEREHDSTLGIDPTTYPIGLFELYLYDELTHSLYASKNFLSKQLSLDYENGGFSTLRELVAEVKDFTVFNQNNSITVTLPLYSEGNDISENWLLFSNEALFEKEESLHKWIDVSIEKYTQVNKWLTAEGNYKKLPWSIEPFTKLGYGRNPGWLQDKTALDQFESTGERFFYNLTMNSVASLEAYNKEDETVWLTEYTSTWLKNSYDTIAPFVDTRHNENIALYLTRVGLLFNIENLKDAHVDYAEYLLNQVEKENTFSVGEDSFFIADYYSPHPGTRKTHASLNHVVGEINFLLDSYILTNDTRYLDLAKTMRRAIEDIGVDWIRDSGDLWYQINTDLSFDGNDYEQLTLSDLLTSQQKWEEAKLERSHLFDTLISSKVNYLVANDKKILPFIEKMLVEQGFSY